jgi:transposase
MTTPQTNSSDRARVKVPQRTQREWREFCFEDLVGADHRVRAVWRFVAQLDLSPLYAKIKAVEGGVGRDAVDPQLLVALWLYATIEGVSSARELERRCRRDAVYQWLCGGVSVNYHLLSDFRTAHGEWLDRMLTDTVAALLHQELVTLETVAQDGMRVRANAGSSSFHRPATLEQCRETARAQVQRLREEAENEAEASQAHARREAAHRRAAEEREARVEQALKEVAQLQQEKESRKKGDGEKARASTTDPEARRMKMADGGFRPAYNVQFATDGDARVIVGIDVTNSGNDHGKMAPMYEQLHARYGQRPLEYQVDGGFAKKEDITTLEQHGTKVFAPLHGAERMRNKGRDPYAPQPDDSAEMRVFRQRMATEEAKEKYKRRPSIAEFPNADCRNRGLTQFRVRGLNKVKAVALWYALAFNFLRILDLTPSS